MAQESFLGKVSLVLFVAICILAACNRGGEAMGSVAGPNRYESRGLPVMLELGSVHCIPCKKMAPIVDRIRDEHKGRLIVEFHDVREHPEIGAKYGVGAIPTQVFIDSEGNEVFRHIGFLSYDEILNVLRTMDL